MSNAHLLAAKMTAQDEFYTRKDDIVVELMHYSMHFKNKVVFCNCDDPTYSNFWCYFHENFEVLGLRKLVSTHYEVNGEPSYCMEYDGGNDDDCSIGVVKPLIGNGDFRSDECIRLLEASDVVVTNPPFSLFREYVALLVAHKKKFLIIGNKNAAHNKDIYPMMAEGEMWFGYNKPGNFRLPDGTITKKVNGLCRWYTNLDIEKCHRAFFSPEEAHAYYEGNEDKYPIYDNFNGIDVKNIDMIPIDFKGYMGVPVTFFDKYNPDDFELIGLGSGKLGASIGVEKNYRGRTDIAYTKNGKSACPYGRIIIRNKHPRSRFEDEAM